MSVKLFVKRETRQNAVRNIRALATYV